MAVLHAARRPGVRRVVDASYSVYVVPMMFSPHPRTLTPSRGLRKLSRSWSRRVFTELGGLETVVLRYFNVFGPRQGPDSACATVIPRFIDA